MKDQSRTKEQIASEVAELRRRIADLERQEGGHGPSEKESASPGTHRSWQPDERYRSLFEQSRDAIAIAEEDGTIIDANQALSDLFDCPKARIIGRNALDTWADPSERQAWQREMTRHGSVTDYEFRARKPDGSLIDCLLSSTLLRKKDGSIVYQSIVRDISERKRDRKALRESEERYRKITENSLAGLYIHQRGVLRYVNGPLAKMLGYSPEEMIGREFWDFVHTDDRESIRKTYSATPSDSASHTRYLFRVVCKNRDVKWVEAIAGTIDFQGQASNMGHLIDITDRHEFEQALYESEEKFRALSEASFEAIYLTEDGVCISQNLAAEKMFGYTAEETRGRLGVGIYC